MKILFVCKYNAFRSRVAEEYFNRVNRNKRIKTISRGIILGGNSDPEQRGVSRKLLGVNIAKRKPIIMSIDDMKEADKIIVVANDVPKIIFNYSRAPIMKKVVIWNIRDEQRRNKKNIKSIVLSIKRRVDELAEKWKQ